MNIFVSYTTKDHEISLVMLNQISTRLKQIGTVYVDILDNNSLDKQKRVFDELDNSDVIVLIVSNNVYNSKWVIKEIERARKLLIPIISFSVHEIMTFKMEIISTKIEFLLSRKLINNIAFFQ